MIEWIRCNLLSHLPLNECVSPSPTLILAILTYNVIVLILGGKPLGGE